MSIVDASEKYLRIVKKGQTNRQLADALVHAGYKSEAKQFVDTVRSVLHRSGKFVWINNRWELAEWQQGSK